MRTSSSFYRFLLVLAALALSSIAGLAMASVQSDFGPNLLDRWLVGWAITAFVLVPSAWLIQRQPAVRTTILRRYRHPVRHPRRLG